MSSPVLQSPLMKRFLFLFLLIPFLAAQTATEVEITSEPSHHLALENNYLRVFKVEVAPHTATLMHRHRHDYIYVTLGDAHISNEVEGKAPVDLRLADGEARFTAGNFAHVTRNLSDQPFRNVTIELMQDEKLRQTPSHWAEENGEKTFPGGRRQILFVRDGVRVSAVTWNRARSCPATITTTRTCWSRSPISIYAATSKEWARCLENSSPATSNGCRETTPTPWRM